MPFQTNGKRDYKKELNWEKTSKPGRVKDRAKRNSDVIIANANGVL